MKKNLVYLLCVIALFTSCSPAYKTSQTPDDVYYSPAQKIYSGDRYEAYTSSSDDDYLRMKVRNHYRWSGIDDYNYWYDSRYYYNNFYNPYSSGLSLGIGFGYNYYPYYSYSPYWYNPWHSWYSPYSTVVYYKNPGVYYRPLNTHGLSTYNNRYYNNYNMPLQNGNRNRYSNSNFNNNRIRNFNFGRNQNNNSNPVRSFNSGSSHISSGSHISGGGSRTRP